MDPDPPSLLLFLPLNLFLLSTGGIAAAVIFLIVLLVLSALVSGSEVAFFSLSPNDIDNLEKEETPINKLVLRLRNKPRRLLATILISNNFINIAIVIISDFLIRNMLGESVFTNLGVSVSAYLPFEPETIGRVFSFLITTVGVTFLLVLFGEIAPKIYANLNNNWFSKLMARPMTLLSTLLYPFSRLLVNWSSKMESQFIYSRAGLDESSKENLDKAIQLTVDNDTSEDADLLRGIIKFGNVSAKQIMKSRVDVIALEITATFIELMTMIRESGFSRIPIYEEDFDKVVGILYAKDLLGYSDQDESFHWQQFIRERIIYVPESKKIDDVLKEFQKKRVHMAIVVDEFGGSAGLVTLEDIFEEVIGEIKDEFDDDEEVDFIKINDSNYIFEGKTLLPDVSRIINADNTTFDAFKDEADSLAGLILHHMGRIPKKDKEITIGQFRFKIVQVNKRRIEKIHVTLL